MFRTLTAIAAILLLTACSTDVTASFSGTGVDIDKIAAVQANIEEFCADGTLSFCDELTEATNGRPDVTIAIASSLLIVGIHASAEADADKICHDLAAFHYNGDGTDLGYTHVWVISGGNKVADCKIP